MDDSEMARIRRMLNQEYVTSGPIPGPVLVNMAALCSLGKDGAAREDLLRGIGAQRAVHQKQQEECILSGPFGRQRGSCWLQSGTALASTTRPKAASA